jgi:hypothetical protein
MNKLIFSWRLTPQQENRRLRLLLIFSVAGLLFVAGLLTSCKPKPKPVSAPPATTPAVDTAQKRLEWEADQAGSVADTLRKAANQSITNYQNAAKRYDSLRNELKKN